MGALRHLIAIAMAACWLGCGPALAEKRVALVIGNSAYLNVPRLTNAVNDAGLVAAMLKNAGFDSVTTKLDVNIVEMRKALREFGAQTRDADIAVIYYAGHGIELDGANYLIPTDATLESDTDVLDETFPLDRVLFAVEPAKQLRLIILDACRDNPFAKNMKRTVGSRDIGRGLAKVEPNRPNTMIAFAAKAGSTASDGDSKNSPFATALVEYLPKPGLDLRKAFGFVRDDVLKNTGYQQEPYVYGSLGGNDMPIVPPLPVVAAPQSGPQQGDSRKDYELAIQLGTRDAWNAFLAQYPDGFYANLAKGQLNKIAAEEARAAAAEKAQLAEQEKTRLVAEGAKQAELAKAVAAAKAAEEARIAAEKAKQVEDAKAAAGEKVRIAEQGKANVAASDKDQQVDTVNRAAAEPTRPPTDDIKQPIAVLSAPAANSDQKASDDVPRALQAELRRVGCKTGEVDSEWSASARRALSLFNENAGTKFDVKIATIDALDAVRAKTGPVCPLECERGFRASGDQCVKITCDSDQVLGPNGTCRPRPKPAPNHVARQRPLGGAGGRKCFVHGGTSFCE